MPTVYYTDGTYEKIKDYTICKEGRDFSDKNTTKLIKDRIIKTNSININGIIDYNFIRGYNGNCFDLGIIPQINNSFLKELQKDFTFVKKFYMSNNLIKDNELDFTMFKKLEKIKLSINLLTEIPKSIFTLKNLKKLIIRGIPNMEFCDEAPYAYITNIPKEIKNLQNLSILDLSSQGLSSLPSEFKELKNLKELYLSDNMFKEFPIEICSLINLEKLEMNCNLSKHNIDYYENIEVYFDAGKNQSYIIPNEIINLQKLRILKLQGRYIYELYQHEVAGIISGYKFINFPKYFLEKMNIEELYINNFNINNYNSNILFEEFKVTKNLIIYSNNLKYPEGGGWANHKNYKIEISYDEKNNIITIINNIKNNNNNEIIIKYKLAKNSDKIELSIYDKNINKKKYNDVLKDLDEEDQTPEICLTAIKNNNSYFEYVKNKTPEIYLAAVQTDGEILEYVENQTPEICLAAVQNYVWALKYVKEQTPEICLAAVQNRGSALQFVKEQTPEICLAAVQNCGSALQYVKEQTPEICLAAVQNCDSALQYVKEQTPEICLAVVKIESEDGEGKPVFKKKSVKKVAKTKVVKI